MFKLFALFLLTSLGAPVVGAASFANATNSRPDLGDAPIFRLSDDIEFDEMKITKSPNQTLYFKGEPFSTDGIEVYAFYIDWETFDYESIDITSQVAYSNYDTSVPGEQDVHVNYVDLLGDEHFITYKISVIDFDEVSEDTYACTSSVLVPAIEQRFAAPGGYAFTLTPEKSHIKKLIDSAVLFDASLADINLDIYYTTLSSTYYNGVVRYSFPDEDTHTIEERAEIITDYLYDQLSGYMLFSRKECQVEDLVSVSFNLKFSLVSYSSITLKFYGDPITVKPFNIHDFIDYSLYFTRTDDPSESSVDVHATPVKGFFADEKPYNDLGFKTDKPKEEESGVPEPEITEVSLYEFINLDNTKAKAYSVKAKVKSIEPLEPGSKIYNTEGRMVIYDFIDIDDDGDLDEVSLPISASTATASSLNWNHFDKYEYVSPSDFAGNQYTEDLVPDYDGIVYNGKGDYVQMTLVRDDDGLTVRGQGIITVIKKNGGEILKPSAGVFYTTTLVAYDDTEVVEFSENGYTTVTLPDTEIPYKIKLEFTSGGVDYVFTTETFIIGKPDISVKVDDVLGRTTVEKNSDHRFSIDVSGYNEKDPEYFTILVSAYPYHLEDAASGIEFFSGSLPTTGEVGKYYYLADPSESAEYLHAHPEVVAKGTYYTWNDKDKTFEELCVSIVDNKFVSQEEYNSDPEAWESMGFKPISGTFDERTSGVGQLPFEGKWYFKVELQTLSDFYSYDYSTSQQTIDVVASKETEDQIVLDLPDTINLINNGVSVDMQASVTNYDPGVDYYYDYSISRAGVIDIIPQKDGKLTIIPLSTGIVTLKINCESVSVGKLTKEVTVRVVEPAYEVATLDVVDGFHKAGEDLTFSLKIRGVSDFQNLNLEWQVQDKNGKDIAPNLYRVNRNASLTLVKPDTGDYTVTAFHEGVKLAAVTVEVRYVDINAFLRANIWWIILITVGFAGLIIFLSIVTRRGKTTVERIQRVYDTYCRYISDDKLTLYELKRMRRQIATCVHKCEDLNIDALNQYEKATRYLKKSLQDVKNLIKTFDSQTPQEKGILTDKLDKDLSKALNVAREIETAKELIENYHTAANKKNFETLEDDKKKKKVKTTEDAAVIIERMSDEITDEPIADESKEKKHK